MNLSLLRNSVFEDIIRFTTGRKRLTPTWPVPLREETQTLRYTEHRWQSSSDSAWYQ